MAYLRSWVKQYSDSNYHAPLRMRWRGAWQVLIGKAFAVMHVDPY
jgi:hypothetical protein